MLIRVVIPRQILIAYSTGYKDSVPFLFTHFALQRTQNRMQTAAKHTSSLIVVHEGADSEGCVVLFMLDSVDIHCPPRSNHVIEELDVVVLEHLAGRKNIIGEGGRGDDVVGGVARVVDTDEVATFNRDREGGEERVFTHWRCWECCAEN
jgi:hypothetical protein